MPLRVNASCYRSSGGAPWWWCLVDIWRQRLNNFPELQCSICIYLFTYDLPFSLKNIFNDYDCLREIHFNFEWTSQFIFNELRFIAHLEINPVWLDTLFSTRRTSGSLTTALRWTSVSSFMRTRRHVFLKRISVELFIFDVQWINSQ